MLDLVYENHTSHDELKEEFFRDIFNILVAHFKVGDQQVELGLQIVEADRIRELNKLHRDKDNPTDVLSFPLDENNLKNYGIIALGDIFLCPEYIETKAKEHEVKFREEVARDAIHGFLHLMGFDHELSNKDERQMLELQENILRLVTKRNK